MKYSSSFLAAIPYHYLPPLGKELSPAVTHATQVLQLHFSSTAAGFFNTITRLFSSQLSSMQHTHTHTHEISKVLVLSVSRYVIDMKFYFFYQFFKIVTILQVNYFFIHKSGVNKSVRNNPYSPYQSIFLYPHTWKRKRLTCELANSLTSSFPY